MSSGGVSGGVFIGEKGSWLLGVGAAVGFRGAAFRGVFMPPFLSPRLLLLRSSSLLLRMAIARFR